MRNDYAFIDTNIFLRYLVFDETNNSLSIRAKEIIESIADKIILGFTNILVISEIAYVLEKYYELDKKDVANKIKTLVSCENLVIDQKESILASLYIYDDKNVDFEDAYSYIQMLEKGIHNIYTFDLKHFKRFENIKILE